MTTAGASTSRQTPQCSGEKRTSIDRALDASSAVIEDAVAGSSATQDELRALSPRARRRHNGKMLREEAKARRAIGRVCAQAEFEALKRELSIRWVAMQRLIIDPLQMSEREQTSLMRQNYQAARARQPIAEETSEMATDRMEATAASHGFGRLSVTMDDDKTESTHRTDTAGEEWTTRACHNWNSAPRRKWSSDWDD